MWKSLLQLLGLRTQSLNRQERLELLQTSIIKAVRAGRDDLDGSTVEFAMHADALLKQTDKPFEQRCGEVHDALADHLGRRLLTRLDTYHH
jgi:hypothetical protein